MTQLSRMLTAGVVHQCTEPWPLHPSPVRGTRKDAGLKPAAAQQFIISSFPELIRIPAILRLMRVSQAGAPSIVNRYRRATRYQHSIGAAHLLYRLGATYDQQLASLLHDIGHFAFSHTIDYLLGNSNEDTHELNPSHQIPSSAEIATATEATINYQQMREHIENRPQWLRQADKIDYTIRDLSNAGLISNSEAADIFRSLDFDGSTLFFVNTGSAVLFCDLLQRAVEQLYMSPISLYQHRVLAEALKQAIELNVIEFGDLEGVDADILIRLRKHPIIHKIVRARLHATPKEVIPSRFRMSSKLRLFEPLVKAGSSVVPLSEINKKAWVTRRDHAVLVAEIGVPAFRYRWTRTKLI